MFIEYKLTRTRGMHTIQCVYCDDTLTGRTQAAAMGAFGRHVRSEHSDALESLRSGKPGNPPELDVAK